MPIEIIKRIQRERAEKAAAEEATRKAAAEKARLEREEQEKEAARLREERRLFVKHQTEKILSESSVLAGLQRIERELLEGNVKEHALVYTPDQGKATLVWGSQFTVKNGEIIDEEVVNYSYIQVSVNPDKETLTINGEEITKNQWKNNQNVELALAREYLNPARKIKPEPYTGGGSSYRDDMGCCCCSGR